MAERRDRFLTAFTHELCTPPSVAIGWARLLEEEPGLSAPDTAGATGRLRGALDRLHERTRDAETLAVASPGRLAVRTEPVRVDDLVGDLPWLGRVGAEGREVLLEVDPALFRRVLVDLWQVAATEPDRLRLEVTAAGLRHELHAVRVAAPIDPRVLRALFEPFEANDDSTGVTTGLYLARTVVVAHGGSMGVDPDDHQATLWVRVPRQPTVDRPDPVAPAGGAAT